MSAKEITIFGLGTSVQEISEHYVGKTESAVKLKKNKTIKDTLLISTDLTLVVPKDCTLALYGGGRVDGTLFVENGAKLLVKSRKLEINGSVINDGYVFISAKSSLSVNDSGTLYTSAKGKISVRTDKVGISEFSSTSWKRRFQYCKSSFLPVCCVCGEDFSRSGRFW